MAKKAKRITSDPSCAWGQGIFAVSDASKPKTDADPWKVGCHHKLLDDAKGCDQTFDPNGTGSVLHTGCPQGQAMLSQYAKSRKAGMTVEALRKAVLERMNEERKAKGRKLAKVD